MKFYEVSIDEGRRKKYAYAMLLGEYLGRNIHCERCGRDYETELLIEKNTKLNIALTNDNYPDFIYALYNILVSERVKEILKSENIEGYCVEEVNVVPKDKISQLEVERFRDNGIKINNIPNTSPVYYRLVAKRSGELHNKSNVVLQGTCEICGYEDYEKMGDFFAPDYIKNESWNGDDLFMVKEFCAMVYCTERFVEIYKKHKLTGLIFEEIEGL